MGSRSEVVELRFSGEGDDQADLQAVCGTLQALLQRSFEQRWVNACEVRLDLLEKGPVLGDPSLCLLSRALEVGFPGAAGERVETGRQLARAMEKERPAGAEDREVGARKRWANHLIVHTVSVQRWSEHVAASRTHRD